MYNLTGAAMNNMIEDARDNEQCGGYEYEGDVNMTTINFENMTKSALRTYLSQMGIDMSNVVFKKTLKAELITMIKVEEEKEMSNKTEVLGTIEDKRVILAMGEGKTTTAVLTGCDIEVNVGEASLVRAPQIDKEEMVVMEEKMVCSCCGKEVSDAIVKYIASKQDVVPVELRGKLFCYGCQVKSGFKAEVSKANKATYASKAPVANKKEEIKVEKEVKAAAKTNDIHTGDYVMNTKTGRLFIVGGAKKINGKTLIVVREKVAGKAELKESMVTLEMLQNRKVYHVVSKNVFEAYALKADRALEAKTAKRAESKMVVTPVEEAKVIAVQ